MVGRRFGILVLLLACASAAHADDSLGAQHYEAGLAYERLGRGQDAYTELQLATNLDPNRALAFVALGIVAMRLGNFDEALRALEKSITLDANSCASYYALALIYEKKNRPDRAAECWDRFLALSHDDLLKAVARKHIAYLQGRP